MQLTARCPEDLLALAPVILGFWPADSVVMMTFGAARPFHARLDLPPAAELDPCTLLGAEESLLGPAQQHEVQAVVLLYLTDDPCAALLVHEALVLGCRRRGIRMVVAVAADGAEYSLLGPDGELGPRTPYDVTAHPFVVQALVEGWIAHDTREEMVASLEADPALAGPVLEALLDGGWEDTGPPIGARALRRHGTWAQATVRRVLDTGDVLRPVDVARLLWAVQAPRVRDAVGSLIERPTASGHARFWAEILRRCPDQLAAPPATLLGWAAWLAGDGALAWAAVDRCRRVDPDCRLADSLARLLERAVAPNAWPGGADRMLGLPAERSER